MQADEAQRGHYNDGYSPYLSYPAAEQYHTSPSPNYEQEHQPYQPIHYDPYSAQQGQPGGFQLPGSTLYQDSYQPNFPQPHSPPPLHPGSPPLHPDAFIPPTGDTIAPSPYPPSTGFQLHDDGPDELGDTGDIPLLRRDAPTGSTTLMPGDYDSMEDDAHSENNIRYGHIPQRVPRRYKTIKKVELFHGNFVLDSAVPSKLLAMCAQRNEREFTHMRYSAATCDPNDFKDSGFTLRQVHYDPPRRTELFIVMTMYNEDEVLFCKTMNA